VITVPLDKNKHDRKRFECTIEPLNKCLQLMTQQQSSKYNARTFVLEDKYQPEFIIGYYTLTMTAL